MKSEFSKEFSPPSGKYKVHVNSGDWKPYSAARLQISMNNPKHTDDKFFAEAEWVAARFDCVQLIVSDTLYKYNIMASHGVDERTAHALARQIGDRWLVDNAKAIAAIPNAQITRWDDWLRHPAFVANHMQVINAYKNDNIFAAEVDRTSELFMRNKGDISEEKRRTYIDLSRIYLLEEIAAFAVMHDEAKMIDVRPGSPLKPVLDLLQSGTVADAPKGCNKINSVIIDFTRNKGYLG